MTESPHANSAPISKAAFDEKLSLARIQIGKQHPFLSSIALFAKAQRSNDFPTAWTDGLHIFFNPHFAATLHLDTFVGVFLHEVLHAAMGHVFRAKGRDPLRWNLAADIVVNAIVLNAGFQLPEGAVCYPEWQDFCVEEVFALLEHAIPQPLNHFTLQTHGDLHPALESTQALAAYWQSATQNAAAHARLMGIHHDIQPQRALFASLHPPLNWRTILAQFLVRTPCDFNGFDRRFLHLRRYVDSIESDSLHILTCIDTSGSISNHTAARFLHEVHAILNSYPYAHIQLFFCDTQLSGPFPLLPDAELPPLAGGGGTDFCPLFDFIQASTDIQPPFLLLYLTDGFGRFPSVHPAFDVLWVLTPGGLPSHDVPFGKVVRMLD